MHTARSYAEARERFVASARRARAAVETHVLPDHRGPDGGALRLDVARVGPEDADVVLLCLSGTHGPEGFAGSAAQVAWLDRRAGAVVPDGVAVVLVHAVNPYGFAHMTRTNEHGVA